MRRASLIGPLILIGIGGLFLLNNLKPELPVMQLVADFWPWILIAWGGLRLLEIVYWRLTDKPLPASGISGGEWFLVVFLSLVGAGIHLGHRLAERWPSARITMRGIELLGESYDFPLEATAKAGKAPRVVIENLRGNARVTGADTEEVKVSGRLTIRAMERSDAEKASAECKLELVPQGEILLVRTNQERATGPQRISADIEITVPRGATVEGRGRYGDFDVNDVQGGVEINSDNAGVRVANIGGDLRVDLRKSDIVRAQNVKGNVEVKGGGWEVDLENIEGSTNINGSYSGELHLRNLAKPLRFQSSRSDVRAEKIKGYVRISRGDLALSEVTGPVVVRSQNKDVIVTDFTESLELNVERGDVEVRPVRLPLARMEIRTGAGDIELRVPDGAKFQMRASAGRGDVEDNYGAPLRHSKEGPGATLTGSVGGGPELNVATDRGTIRVHKGSLEAPPAPKEPPAPKAPPSPSSLSVQEQ